MFSSPLGHALPCSSLSLGNQGNVFDSTIQYAGNNFQNEKQVDSLFKKKKKSLC